MKGVSTPSNLLDSSHTSDFLPSQMRKNQIFKQIQNEEITGWNSGISPTQFGTDNDQFYHNHHISDRFFELHKVEESNKTEEAMNQRPNILHVKNSKLTEGNHPAEFHQNHHNTRYPGQTNALKELSNNLQIHKQQQKKPSYDQVMHQFTQQPFLLQQKGKRKSQQFSSLSNNQNNHTTYNNNFTNAPIISSPNEDFSSIVNELKQLKEFLTSPLPNQYNQQRIQNKLIEASHQFENGVEGRTSSVDSLDREYFDANTRRDFMVRRQRLNSFQVNTLQKQQQNSVNISYDNLRLRRSQQISTAKQYTTQSIEDKQNYTLGQNNAVMQSTHFQSTNGNMINLSSLTGQVVNSAIVNQNNYSLYGNQKKPQVNKANSLEYRRKRGNTLDMLPKISEMQRYQNTIKTQRQRALKTNENSQKSRIGINKIAGGQQYDTQEDQKEQQQLCKTSEDRSSQATINQIKKLMNKERIYYKENFQQLESLKFPSKTNIQNQQKQNSFALRSLVDSNNTAQTNNSNHTLGDQINHNGQVIKIQNQNYSKQSYPQYDDAQCTQESSYNAQYANMPPANHFNSKFQISLAEYLKQNATQKQQFFNNQKKAIIESSRKDVFDFNKNVKVTTEKYSLNNILQHSESPRQRTHIPLNSSTHTCNSKITGGALSSNMLSLDRSKMHSTHQQSFQQQSIEIKPSQQQFYSPTPGATVQQSQQVIIQKGNQTYSPIRDKQEVNVSQAKYSQFNSRIPKKLKELLQEQYVKDSILKDIQIVQNNVM